MINAITGFESGFLPFFADELIREKNELERSRIQAIAAAVNTARPWGDPKSYAEIVGVDFGSGRMHCHALKAGVDIPDVRLADATDRIVSFGRGALVVGESAHLAVPQTAKSLAQPFKEAELLRMYAACKAAGVDLWIFPHAHTTKARVWASRHAPEGFVDPEKTSDMNDARAIAYFVAHNNGISISKPRKSFDHDPFREYGCLVRSRSNRVLSAVKTYGYDGEVFPYLASVAASVTSAAHGTPLFVNHKVAFSIVSLVIGDSRGEAYRFSYRGATPGADRWMRSVAMFSPCHHRGGIARANMMRDRFRPFFAEYADIHGENVKKSGSSYIGFGEHTPHQDQLRRDAWRLARRQVRAAYRLVVDISSHLPPLELLVEEGDK